MGTKTSITEAWESLSREEQMRLFIRAADKQYDASECFDMYLNEVAIKLQVVNHRYLSQRVLLVPRQEMAYPITISSEDFWKLYEGVDDRK